MKTFSLAVAVLVLATVGLVAFGNARWARGTRQLLERLEAGHAAPPAQRFTTDQLAGLPDPVQRYLRTALRDGQARVAKASFAHSGTFNTSADGESWHAFRSAQRVVVGAPGFVWDASVSMIPGVPVRVHDAYVGGEGVLRAAVFGLFAVADDHGGGDLARGELMRFFAEMTWYPTALAPGGAVRWSPIDARSARASLDADGQHIELVFTFGADGLVERVRADARGRSSGGRVDMLPWEGRFWNYTERDGMQVPQDGEVAWITPAGPKPYWRGRLESVAYEFAR